MRLVLALTLLVAIIALVAVWAVGESTCALLYGDPAGWQAFTWAFIRAYPNAQVIVLPDPEIDFTAYCDALQEVAPRFRRLVCQVPCQRASDLLRTRRFATVTLDSSPSLLQSCVICNIVASEQAVVDLLVARAASFPVDGKRVLLSAGEVVAPSGWTRVRVAVSEGGAEAAVQGVSGLKIGLLAISTPVTRATVQALAAGSPAAKILATSGTHEPIPELSLQLHTSGEALGNLAAAMLQGMYRGPREVVSQPVVLGPVPAVQPTPCTRLSAVAQAAY